MSSGRGSPPVPRPLYTSRLALRPTGAGDIRQLLGTYRDPVEGAHESAFFLRVSGPRLLAEITTQMRARRLYHFIARTRAGSEYVGHIALREIDWESRRAELGGGVTRRFWRQGFATEAARRLCSWAFSEARLHRIEAIIAEGNLGAQAVVRELGFQEEGRRREYGRTMGSGRAWIDHLSYGLLAPEFRGSHSPGGTHPT